MALGTARREQDVTQLQLTHKREPGGIAETTATGASHPHPTPPPRGAWPRPAPSRTRLLSSSHAPRGVQEAAWLTTR